MHLCVRSTLRRTALAATTLLTSTGLVLGVGLLAPAGAVTARADASADWLADQLDDGLVVSEYQDEDGDWVRYTDHGLSLDVYYALSSIQTKRKLRRAVLRAIEPEADLYTGVGSGTVYSGAVGKLLTAVFDAGVDADGYGDGNLVEVLEGEIVTNGPSTGLAQNSYNSFGQAYAATALAAAGSSLADDAVAFLLHQQCAPGYFRQSMDSADFTCDGGTEEESSPSVDATATAGLAALTLAESGPVAERAEAAEAARRAAGWLVERQVASGTFAGGRNSNSTGLAAAFLAEAGKDRKAVRAARWVDDLRVTKRLVRTTGYRARDLGAVAFDPHALRGGRRSGITRDERYVWRRSTAQAVLALDLLGR